MQISPAIPRTLLRSWFDHVREDRGRLATSRYLLLGAELAEILGLRKPSLTSLTDLLRTLREHQPKAFEHARNLARNASAGQQALTELAVDELLAATFEWHHPSQVLERPRPEHQELLPVCEQRLREATDDDTREHIHAVVHKVARAARIADEARVRRERHRRGRRRPSK